MTTMTTKKHVELAPIEIGLEDKTRMQACKILAAVLADQHVLYIKKRNFHWNLIGERVCPRGRRSRGG